MNFLFSLNKNNYEKKGIGGFEVPVQVQVPKSNITDEELNRELTRLFEGSLEDNLNIVLNGNRNRNRNRNRILSIRSN